MPQYLTPGVYVEEVRSTSKPIEGVSTSVAAFVGRAPFGPVNTPVQVANWTKFVDTFGNPYDTKAGPFMKGAYLAHAVDGFFRNGGNLCYVVRVGEGTAPGAPQLALPAAEQDALPFRVVAREGMPEKVTVAIEEEESAKPAANGNGAVKPQPKYRVVVTDEKHEEAEEIGGLPLGGGKNYIVTKVNRLSDRIRLEETGPAPLEARPALKTGSYPLEVVDERKPLDSETVQGDVANRTGVDGLAAIDEVTMICVPDIMTLPEEDDRKALQQAMVDHAAQRKDRMAILDSPPDHDPDQVGKWRTERGASPFAALYYPWIEVMDPIDDQPIMVPPCGHVAGVWARTDGTRGVHKAPANEEIAGVTGVSYQVTTAEQELLNPEGINCIRTFPSRGTRIWGARTMATRQEPEWRYINVRRLVNYISESINEGTQWAVFEPNDQSLWTQLRVSTSNFLTRVWRDGALFGATPGEAFFVKCDAETNPPDLVEMGQVTIEVGIAPVKPAEFVVFRISQFQPGEDSAA